MQITDSDRAAIRFVIERQLEAFQHEDAVTAFSLASPGIQITFKTPENFMAMVRSSYEAVYRPRSVLFENLAIVNDALAQPVLVLDPEGNPRRALYQMEKQLDGSWRINGCFLVPIEVQPSI